MALKQFGFAWLSGEFETFDGSQFRQDEQIVSFTVSGNEGDCDNLDIVIKNPKRGLLNGSIWASLSYGTSTGDAVEIFRGRITAIPADIVSETIDVMFVAKPSSYDQQLAILAAELRTLPPYDAIWVDPAHRDDPMTPLECQSALYFVDRVSHAMSITDMLIGEDGTVDITADDLIYDSLKCGSSGDPPMTSVNLIGHANWKQSATGGFQVPNANGQRFTLSGSSLCSSWPKTGSTIAGGYKVTIGFCNDLLATGVLKPVQKNWSYENKQKTHTVGDVMSSSLSYTIFPGNVNAFISNINTQTGSVPAASTIAYEQNIGEVTDSSGDSSVSYSPYDPYASIDGAGSDAVMIPMHVSYNVVAVPIWSIGYALSLSIDSGAGTAETIKFAITANLQPIVILPDPTVATQTIELSTQDLTSDQQAGNPSGITPTGVGPPLDSSSDAFAMTDRGAYAIGYLVAVGRAAIRKASRATNCTGTVPFEKALEFTLRKSATVHDNRLPGGIVNGKLTSYSFGFDGSIATGTFEIMPAVGLAGTIGDGGAGAVTVTPSPGANTYVDNYVDNYTQVSGGVVVPGGPTVTTSGAGDIGYTIDPYTAAGVSALTAADCVISAQWQTGLINVQVGTDDLPGGGTKTYFEEFTTDKFHLELIPANSVTLGSDVPVTTTPLNIPKQIDLSAAPI
jgi:hypothetical protein